MMSAKLEWWSNFPFLTGCDGMVTTMFYDALLTTLMLLFGCRYMLAGLLPL